MDDFRNVYEDEQRAKAYSELEFPRTYFLAFRDLPSIFSRHVKGNRAMDFGCGAGRSTRFLRGLGFDTVGVDISRAMLEKARALDPAGDYRLIPEGDFTGVADERFHLILSAFTFDNATMKQREAALKGMKPILADNGRIVIVVSSPEIYVNEWASFSTKDYPQNRHARTGDKVFVVMLDVTDRRPVEDVFITDEDYQSLFEKTGFNVLETQRPLAAGTEPVEWVSETRVSPWVIYILSGA